MFAPVVGTPHHNAVSPAKARVYRLNSSTRDDVRAMGPRLRGGDGQGVHHAAIISVTASSTACARAIPSKSPYSLFAIRSAGGKITGLSR